MAAITQFFDPRRIRGTGSVKRWFPWRVVNRRGSNFFKKGKREGGGEPEPSVPPTRPRIGIVFSSGGAKGLAHIGVIQVLEENGFEVSAIAGTSMGAYVGACWASGLNGRELETLAARMARGKDRWKLIDPVFPPRRGFIGGDKIEARLRKTLGHKTFADLEIPTYVVATELDSFARHVFHEGDVVSAILASLAVPGIVVPRKREGREFVDGGIAAPLPVSVMREMGNVDRILAVNVIPGIDEAKKAAATAREKYAGRKVVWWKRPLRWLNRHFNYFAHGNLLDILRSAAMGSQMRLVERSAAEADLYLRAVNPIAQWHDYHNYLTYIELGRKAAEDALPELKALFETEINGSAERVDENAAREVALTS